MHRIPNSLPQLELVAPSSLAVNETFRPRVRVRKPPAKAEWAPIYFLDEPHRIEYSLPRSPASPFNASPRGMRFLDNTDREWTGTLVLDAEPNRNGPSRITVSDVNPLTRRASPVLGEFSYDRPGIYWLDGGESTTKSRFTSNPIVV